ncbi:hypothetical protein Poly21_51510 [Allorhodopirellula heiligendammensis]|uniref:Uncharacterized protein n=2 Tax=Allorhodopirellula heiligendammensis TaxID=2714739 RepID=A0A5C6BFB0_9BACT|nr:hypothetical protein Poly21_51510 [Allorhodopirellula heiligendammensis]|tara:strand:- start:687 stop:998 length:312 start_codon:yes stop_codon:yes gene_type:complete
MQPIVRSRVLPRISFRAMMLWTVVAALIAAIARAAGDGATFAKAVTFAVAMLGLFFLLAAGAFLLAWLTARFVIGEFDNSREGNPFAKDQLPPQLLKPREREQ